MKQAKVDKIFLDCIDTVAAYVVYGHNELARDCTYRAKEAVLDLLLGLPELQDEEKKYPEDAKHMQNNRVIRIGNFSKHQIRQAITTAIMGEEEHDE